MHKSSLPKPQFTGEKTGERRMQHTPRSHYSKSTLPNSLTQVYVASKLEAQPIGLAQISPRWSALRHGTWVHTQARVCSER